MPARVGMRGYNHEANPWVRRMHREGRTSLMWSQCNTRSTGVASEGDGIPGINKLSHRSARRAIGRIYGSATGVLVRPELLTEINEDLYRNGKNGGVIQILYFSETERRRRRSRGFLLSDVRPPGSARRLASLQHVSTEKWLYVKKWIWY
jgi:hypothetical protein